KLLTLNSFVFVSEEVGDETCRGIGCGVHFVIGEYNPGPALEGWNRVQKFVGRSSCLKIPIRQLFAMLRIENRRLCIVLRDALVILVGHSRNRLMKDDCVSWLCVCHDIASRAPPILTRNVKVTLVVVRDAFHGEKSEGEQE